MGCPQNYEPLLVIEYISAPNILGYQNGTVILGTLHIRIVWVYRGYVGFPVVINAFYRDMYIYIYTHTDEIGITKCCWGMYLCAYAYISLPRDL